MPHYRPGGGGTVAAISRIMVACRPATDGYLATALCAGNARLHIRPVWSQRRLVQYLERPSTARGAHCTTRQRTMPPRWTAARDGTNPMEKTRHSITSFHTSRNDQDQDLALGGFCTSKPCAANRDAFTLMHKHYGTPCFIDNNPNNWTYTKHLLQPAMQTR